MSILFALIFVAMLAMMVFAIALMVQTASDLADEISKLVSTPGRSSGGMSRQELRRISRRLMHEQKKQSRKAGRTGHRK